jgi:anti-sigma regulatory factor (Ser/Thr protein kinase)/ActR/RegA family two-component response regulator
VRSAHDLQSTASPEITVSRVLIIASPDPVTHEVGDLLTAAGLPIEYAAGHIDAIHQLRRGAFGVIITSADGVIDEALALLQEMRLIRPNLKCIVLAPYSTPDEIIAALRARVFGCFTPPFDAHEIFCVARTAATSEDANEDIEVLSARPGWIAVRVNCRLATADRLMSFAREFAAQLPETARQEIMLALREILVNAMEHGAAFNPDQVVEVNAIRTARTMTFRVRDPGAGFRREAITHAAHSNSPDDPTAHIVQRNEQGMRAGGYGLLLAAGTVDELIYNEMGNEVLLIKYLDPAGSTP